MKSRLPAILVNTALWLVVAALAAMGVFAVWFGRAQ